LLGVDSLGVCVAASCACGCGHGGEAVVAVGRVFLDPVVGCRGELVVLGSGVGREGIGEGEREETAGAVR